MPPELVCRMTSSWDPLVRARSPEHRRDEGEGRARALGRASLPVRIEAAVLRFSTESRPLARHLGSGDAPRQVYVAAALITAFRRVATIEQIGPERVSEVVQAACAQLFGTNGSLLISEGEPSQEGSVAGHATARVRTAPATSAADLRLEAVELACGDTSPGRPDFWVHRRAPAFVEARGRIGTWASRLTPRSRTAHEVDEEPIEPNLPEPRTHPRWRLHRGRGGRRWALGPPRGGPRRLRRTSARLVGVVVSTQGFVVGTLVAAQEAMPSLEACGRPATVEDVRASRGGEARFAVGEVPVRRRHVRVEQAWQPEHEAADLLVLQGHRGQGAAERFLAGRLGVGAAPLRRRGAEPPDVHRCAVKPATVAPQAVGERGGDTSAVARRAMPEAMAVVCVAARTSVERPHAVVVSQVLEERLDEGRLSAVCRRSHSLAWRPRFGPQGLPARGRRPSWYRCGRGLLCPMR